MNLTDFPIPRNKSKRGIHGSASCYPEEGHWRERLALCRDMGLGWYKFLDDGGGSGINVYRVCWHEYGIMPIVRFYQSAPGRVGPREADAIKRIVDVVGVPVYFQICNEPDLPIEWPDRKQPKDWLQQSIDAYCQYAPTVLGLGGLPGTFSLASGAFGQVRIDENGNVIEPVKINYLKAIHDKNPYILGYGGWVAMHNYTLNHPLNYPYDDVNRYGTPLTQAEYDAAPGWAWDNRPMSAINEQRARDKNGPDTSIWTDDSCFRAYEVFLAHLAELGLTEVPVITAEGGPCMTDGPDGRYVKIHQGNHAEFVEGIYREIGPIRQYFTYSHWLYYNTTGGWATNCWLDGPQDHSQTINKLKATPVGAWGELLTFDGPGPEPPDPPTPPVPPPTPKPKLEWLIPDWNDAAPVISNYAPGEVVWKLTRAELAPDNIANTVWVNVYDENGLRVNVPVMTLNVNGVTETLPYKPGEAYNRPMWKNDRLKVWIGANASDAITDMHGAYWGVPGVNAFHVGYILEFRRWTASAAEPEPPPEPPEPEPVTDEMIRNAAWNNAYPSGGVAFNPQAAFQAVARERGLGAPVTNEFDLGPYRVQGFSMSILYAVIGDWQNVIELSW